MRQSDGCYGYKKDVVDTVIGLIKMIGRFYIRQSVDENVFVF